MNATCTEEFEKALGKMLNENRAMGLVDDQMSTILIDIARHWFELGFNAAQKTEHFQPCREGEVVVTWDESQMRILAVTRQDEEGHVISVIAEATKQGEQA